MGLIRNEDAHWIIGEKARMDARFRELEGDFPESWRLGTRARVAAAAPDRTPGASGRAGGGEPPQAVEVEALPTEGQEPGLGHKDLMALFEASLLAVVALDPGGRITFWNAAAERMFGWTESEVLGRLNPAFQLEKPDEQWRPGGASEGTAVWKELRGHQKDGTAIDVRASPAPVVGTGRRIVGTLLLLDDVTQRKYAEKVQESRKLEAQVQRARRMESLGVLAGGIAHDFNNILTTVFGFTELALGKIPPDSPVRTDLEEVLKSAHRARVLVQQILHFSRQDTDERQPVALGPVVAEVVEQVRLSLPDNVKVHCQVVTANDVVMAAAGQMRQVVMNLCTNAGYAMREQGGSLTVRLSNVTLAGGPSDHGADLKPGPYVELSVVDSGPGMDSSVSDRVLQPFFTTKPKGKGAGMGLAMVYGIVRKHGGEVTVFSQPNRGQVFRVLLPQIK